MGNFLFNSDFDNIGFIYCIDYNKYEVKYERNKI